MAKNEKRKTRILFYGDLVFFVIFTFTLLSTAFLNFYKEMGIEHYVIIGSVLGITFTVLYSLWLAVTKRRFILG